MKGKATYVFSDGTTFEWEVDLVQEVDAAVCEEIDRFDRLTAKGYRLNLLTGKYDFRVGPIDPARP